MSTATIEQEIGRIEVETGCGRVVVYLPVEAAEKR
jgi:hypothetical protein